MLPAHARRALFAAASALLCGCSSSSSIDQRTPDARAVDAAGRDARFTDAAVDAATVDAAVDAATVDAAAPFLQRLLIPPVLSGTHIRLVAAPSTTELLPGVNTPTYGINGNYLGPTLVLRRGDDVRIDVVNELDEMTTMHWHGLHVAAEDDGGPHTMIAPGATWSPEFTVRNEAATYWYHPHPHGKTTAQISLGLAGLIIVQDSHEGSLSLPRTYGVDDIPMIVQDKDFTDQGTITTAGLGDTIMVNGQVDAIADVPAQYVRFRLLNASNMRTYAFGLSDSRAFHQIATDNGLLEQPVPLTRVRLAPGERAEIVVDLSQDQGTELSLMSYSSELRGGIVGGPGSPPGPGSTLNGTDFVVMRVAVGAPVAPSISQLPATLITRAPWAESEATVTRQVQMTRVDRDFLFDDAPFNMDIINHTVRLDAVEIWEIENLTAIAHPFHIHDIGFYILSRNGRAPDDNERGLKDTVQVMPSERLRFITRFETFADPDTPYMYHCHLLPHEDAGMMGQFVVIP